LDSGNGKPHREDAPLASPEFAEALRAFCKDVVAAQ
jgi:hypothetical protein